MNVQVKQDELIAVFNNQVFFKSNHPISITLYQGKGVECDCKQTTKSPVMKMKDKETVSNLQQLTMLLVTW